MGTREKGRACLLFRPGDLKLGYESLECRTAESEIRTKETLPPGDKPKFEAQPFPPKERLS